ncbi:hypothetical protein Y710_03975 [Gordonia sp. QH-12]|nr:hypothetical protein Y710_03975 [Gordonia sp. QH-12]
MTVATLTVAALFGIGVLAGFLAVTVGRTDGPVPVARSVVAVPAVRGFQPCPFGAGDWSDGRRCVLINVVSCPSDPDRDQRAWLVRVFGTEAEAGSWWVLWGPTDAPILGSNWCQQQALNAIHLGTPLVSMASPMYVEGFRK